MATLADYDVVTDAPFSLSVNQQNDLPLAFGAGFDAGIRSVLSYMIDPGPNGATYTMTILSGVDTVIVSTAVPAGTWHLRQEVIDADVLTNPDTLRVRVTNGSAAFSDIVLMHQVVYPVPVP